MTNFLISRKKFVYHLVALDTSKDFADTEQLAVFVRGVTAEFKIYEEYLTLRSIHGTTKGTDIFCEFQAILVEANLDPSKMFAVATDSMLGTIERFVPTVVMRIIFCLLDGIIAFFTRKVLLLCP